MHVHPQAVANPVHQPREAAHGAHVMPDRRRRGAAELVEIAAGGEVGAIASQHRSVERGIEIQQLKRLGELVAHCGVQRVASLRSVEGDGQQTTVALGKDRRLVVDHRGWCPGGKPRLKCGPGLEHGVGERLTVERLFDRRELAESKKLNERDRRLRARRNRVAKFLDFGRSIVDDDRGRAVTAFGKHDVERVDERDQRRVRFGVDDRDIGPGEGV